ncbi:MAG: UDP-N-acetylmuramoyl-tripeptide--D-alanyl-D-alanine ligase, partial [Pseudomonadota bacterium]
ANVGEVFLAGAAMAALSDVLPGTIQQHHAVKAAQLQEIVKNRLTDGDVVLIKGSNASGMKGLADELRRWSAAAVGSVMEHGAERAGQGD